MSSKKSMKRTAEQVLDRRASSDGKFEYLLQFQEPDVRNKWEPEEKCPPELVSEFRRYLDGEVQKLQVQHGETFRQGFEKAEKRLKTSSSSSDEEELPHPPEKVRKGKANSKALKRPISAFFFFCKDQRPQIREQNPEMTFPQVAKELGMLWRIAGPETKKRYNMLAQMDKKRHKRDIEECNQNNFLKWVGL